MPYIVKSSLDIGGKIIPWNEKETNKLIKEKEEFLSRKEELKTTEEIKEEKESEEFKIAKENESDTKKTKTEAKKIQKAGEK